MPTTVYGKGARGRIQNEYFAQRGFKTLEVMVAEDKAIIDAAADASGVSSLEVHVLSYATAVPLPKSKAGGYSQAEAFEIALEGDDGNARTTSFHVHVDALTTNPAAPPTAPAATAPATTAAASTKREDVILAKLFTSKDDVLWFQKSMTHQLEIKGWAGASPEQIAHQILSNISKDIAAGMITDGARTMAADSIFALMNDLPQAHNNAVRKRMEVARAKCTDSEDFVEFTQRLLRRIVTAYGFETIAEWVASSGVSGHEEWVCQTIINILAHASPPRLYGVVTAQMDTLTAAKTVSQLKVKRAELLKLGNTNAELRNTDDSTVQAADVFAMNAQLHAGGAAPPAATMENIATALASLAATVGELKSAHDRRGAYDPKRHTPCKKCDGKGVATAGERPGEHLSYRCPGKP